MTFATSITSKFDKFRFSIFEKYEIEKELKFDENNSLLVSISLRCKNIKCEKKDEIELELNDNYLQCRSDHIL